MLYSNLEKHVLIAQLGRYPGNPTEWSTTTKEPARVALDQRFLCHHDGRKSPTPGYTRDAQSRCHPIKLACGKNWPRRQAALLSAVVSIPCHFDERTTCQPKKKTNGHHKASVQRWKPERKWSWESTREQERQRDILPNRSIRMIQSRGWLWPATWQRRTSRPSPNWKTWGQRVLKGELFWMEAFTQIEICLSIHWWKCLWLHHLRSFWEQGPAESLFGQNNWNAEPISSDKQSARNFDQRPAIQEWEIKTSTWSASFEPL